MSDREETRKMDFDQLMSKLGVRKLQGQAARPPGDVAKSAKKPARGRRGRADVGNQWPTH